eukprot:Sro50_g029170.2  (167) ;mRNA; r:95909-96409
MDGTSFLPVILDSGAAKQDDPWRQDFLVSYHGRGYAQCDNFWGCPAPKQGDPDYHMGDWSNNTYHCVRTIAASGSSQAHLQEEENSIYCRFLDDENFVEYYDLMTDPWELNNAASSLTVEQKIRYERRLEELRICRGKTCRDASSGTHAFATTTTASVDVEIGVSD